MAVAWQEITTENRLLDKSESESIGLRVRQLRLARGWSLDRLAQEARLEGGQGLSRGTIWEMENKSQRVPWDATLRAIATALDVPVEYLRTGQMPASTETLAEFAPEAYFRAKGIKRSDLIQMLSHQFRAAQRLNDLEPEETENDPPAE